MPQTAIVILAAGASSRMGGQDKLLRRVDGTPLLARVIACAMDSGPTVLVTLPDPAHPRADLVRDSGATPVFVPNWSSGMAASIVAGVSALGENVPGVMILPADMPDLQAGDLRALAQTARAHPGAIIRATTPTGTPGHPVIFPAEFFADLKKLRGDQGARALIGAHQHRLMPQIIPSDRAILDLDTQADWAAWETARARQKGGSA